MSSAKTGFGIEDVLEAIRVALSPDHVRPLTDTVIVRAPEEVPYTVEYHWYLVKENASLAGSISAAVATAEEEYVQWQHSKPGRDINPDELRNRINHNEPICFVNRKCDFSYVKGMYTIISDFLTWIDPEIMPSLKEVDKVCKIIEKEENKQKQ